MNSRYFPISMITPGIVLFMTVLFSFFSVHAQVNDTLSEVKIEGRRTENISSDPRLQTYSPGQKIKTIDSLTLVQYQFQSIANLLSQQVPVFVRSYGFNGLATLNFRGASAAQSQVYWNGIPLQNAALGVADLSLLPVSMVDKINIVYGSSSALWGSGNVGGALVIENNEPTFSAITKFTNSISSVAGSFGQFSFGLYPSLSKKRWYVTAHILGQSAKNDFSYPNTGIDAKLTNAASRGANVLFNTAYKLNDISTINFTGFYRKYYREIPPAVFEPVSVKNQKDRNLRLQLNWKRNGTKIGIYAKAAFIKDVMLYDDTIVTLHAENITGQLYAEAGINYKLNPHHHLLVFAPLQYSWIDRELMHDTKTQNKLAIAAAWAMNYFKERLSVSLNAREEAIDDKTIFLPGANACYSLFKWLSLRGNIQRTYRAPTLNELYYIPGGNDKLKPEQGRNEDAGYRVKLKQGGAFSITHDLSYFNRNIKDWIIWFGGSVWTPHNIATVHSRGVETENSLQFNSGKWKLHLGVNTSYVLATTAESYILNDGSIGKQIPYSPRYNGQLNAGFGYKGWYLNYNHTYTGYRFVTTDESQYLEPYNTANAQLLYMVILGAYRLQFSAQCNNLFNNRYQVVSARPMPGINWLVGAKVDM
jgi:vitamin B12 transporter